MINCLFCEQHNCEWWGVDRWEDSCPATPDIEDEEEEANRREYEDEQAELMLEEELAIAAVHRRVVPNA